MRVPKEKLALGTFECKASYLAERHENDAGSDSAAQKSDAVP